MCVYVSVYTYKINFKKLISLVAGWIFFRKIADLVGNINLSVTFREKLAISKYSNLCEAITNRNAFLPFFNTWFYSSKIICFGLDLLTSD